MALIIHLLTELLIVAQSGNRTMKINTREHASISTLGVGGGSEGNGYFAYVDLRVPVFCQGLKM